MILIGAHLRLNEAKRGHVSMSTTALIIIDMQAGLFQLPEPVYQGEALVATIRQLRERADAAHIPTIYVQHNTGGELDGTPAWEIHSDLAPRTDEVVIQKYTPDAFYETDLHAVLDARNTQHLVLTGFATDYCIDTTCRQAWSRGYQVTLVKGGHSTLPSPVLSAPQIIAHHEHILQPFMTLVSVDELPYCKVRPAVTTLWGLLAVVAVLTLGSDLIVALRRRCSKANQLAPTAARSFSGSRSRRSLPARQHFPPATAQ
jgi:nicotinamidase-related amidase